MQQRSPAQLLEDDPRDRPKNGDGSAKTATRGVTEIKIGDQVTLPELRPKPSSYAIDGDEVAWARLGLMKRRPQTALYVGKSEDSLVSRDLDDHFGDGRTGSSSRNSTRR